jgi:glycolate oxidase FAD binding subunit
MIVSAAASVVCPTSVAGVRDVVRDAAAHSDALRIAGSGTWLDANRPVRAATMLSTSALAGVLEYVPGDLTLTARAGTTLAEIAATTAAHGQWLTLDPFGSEHGTLGATIATASYGPYAHHFGTPRDVVLGAEFVTGTGSCVRGGGRVVKNVAGFDLARLVTGSWGALGVLTEITVRLRALPEHVATLAVDVGDTAERLREVQYGLRRLPFVPLSAELLDAAMGRQAGLTDNSGPRSGCILLLRIGGNGAALRAQREQLHTIGTMRDTDDEAWKRLRAAEPSRAAVARWSALPSRFAETWLSTSRVVERWPGTMRHGDPGRGVVRCILPLDSDGTPDVAVASLRAALDVPFDGTRIYERLLAPVWDVLAPTRAADRLSQGVKSAFDPHHVLNPGILGESD